jgi:hypothetical protein
MNTFKTIATRVMLVAVPIAFLAIETAPRVHV